MSPRDWKGLVPREHGSWAYVLGPQIAAVIGSPRPAASILWSAGSLLLFCAFQGLAAAWRRKEKWSTLGTIAGLAGLALSAAAARHAPLALASLLPGGITALLGIFSMRGRLARAALLEVMAIVSLSIQGGTALMLGGGSPADAILLAIACTAYFLLSLIWVRVRLAAEIPGRSPLLRHGSNIPVSLMLLFVSALAGIMSGNPIAGFMPGIYLIRSLLPVPRRSDGRLWIPRLGAQEAVFAGIFALGLGLFLPE